MVRTTCSCAIREYCGNADEAGITDQLQQRAGSRIPEITRGRDKLEAPDMAELPMAEGVWRPIDVFVIGRNRENRGFSVFCMINKGMNGLK